MAEVTTLEIGSILSARTKEGLVELTLNGEKTRMTLAKAREVREDRCPSDEHHCACVVHLRRELRLAQERMTPEQPDRTEHDMLGGD